MLVDIDNPQSESSFEKNVFFVMTYSLRVILCLMIKTKVATNSIGPILEKTESKVTHFKTTMK